MPLDLALVIGDGDLVWLLKLAGAKLAQGHPLHAVTAELYRSCVPTTSSGQGQPQDGWRAAVPLMLVLDPSCDMGHPGSIARQQFSANVRLSSSHSQSLSSSIHFSLSFTLTHSLTLTHPLLFLSYPLPVCLSLSTFQDLSLLMLILSHCLSLSDSFKGTQDLNNCPSHVDSLHDSLTLTPLFAGGA